MTASADRFPESSNSLVILTVPSVRSNTRCTLSCLSIGPYETQSSSTASRRSSISSTSNPPPRRDSGGCEPSQDDKVYRRRKCQLDSLVMLGPLRIWCMVIHCESTSVACPCQVE